LAPCPGPSKVASRSSPAEEEPSRSFVEAAAESLGGLDILVNNAGVMLLGPVQGADPDEWRRMVEVNCLGLLYCTHAAIPLKLREEIGDLLEAEDIAEAISYAVTQPQRVNVNEVLVRPTGQQR